MTASNTTSRDELPRRARRWLARRRTITTTITARDLSRALWSQLRHLEDREGVMRALLSELVEAGDLYPDQPTVWPSLLGPGKASPTFYVHAGVTP